MTCLACMRNGQKIIITGAERARGGRLGDGLSEAVGGVERELIIRTLALTLTDLGSHWSVLS